LSRHTTGSDGERSKESGRNEKKDKVLQGVGKGKGKGVFAKKAPPSRSGKEKSAGAGMFEKGGSRRKSIRDF